MAKAAPMLSLQHFMLQSTLIHAYRSAVRATRPIPDISTRRETLDFFRSDLERLKFISDTDVLKQHISAFKRLVKQMIPSIGLGGLTSETGAKLVGRGGQRTWHKRGFR